MKKTLLLVFAIGIVSFQSLYAVTAPSYVYLPVVQMNPAPTIAPTETITLPTETPTETMVPPTETPTDTPISPTATATQSIAVCRCDADVYDCGDFSTHAAAQACFDYCVSLGKGDIHKLDRDNDGVACESLPLWVKVWTAK